MAPIKRHAALQSLSREHHHTLLLVWKIKAGIAKDIDVARIKKYARWFYEKHLLPHFEAEEKELQPILPNHPLTEQMKEEHANIRQQFLAAESKEDLLALAESLNAHVRFEERLLFNEIQQVATTEQLQLLAQAHQDEKFVENTEDEFWK